MTDCKEANMAHVELSQALPITTPARSQVSPVAWRGYAFGASAAVIWGLYLALAREGISKGLTPIDIAVFRYVTAGLVMLPYAVLHWSSIRAIGLWRGLVLTALAGPPFILFAVGGYQFAPLAHGAVIQPAMVTVLSMLLAVWVLGERLQQNRILGVAVILSGVAVIAGPGLFSGSALSLIGDAMFAAAGLLWALFATLARHWRIPPVAGTAMVAVLSGLIMAPIAIVHIGFAHYASLPADILVAQIAVQGVLTGVISIIAYTTAVTILGSGKAVFPALVPAAAILAGVPIASEWPTLMQTLGLAIVSTGLAIAIGLLRLRS
jgi:drug/metabolite transporter (DMT)-like permease